MALDVTVGGASADAYDTLANGLTYYAERGYCGSAWSGSPLVKGAVAADGTAVVVDGANEGETILKGDAFTVADAAGEFEFTQRGEADSGGEFPSLSFSPAAAAGLADNAALATLALTDEMVRRGVMELDERFRNRLKGAKTSSGQALAWPRIHVDDEDGNNVASDTIPTAVKRAAWEMARITSTEMVATGGQKIKAAGAGSARVEFATSYVVDTTLDFVDRLMRPYLAPSNRLVRA